MRSFSEYGLDAGAVHGTGWPFVWCPRYRKEVFVSEDPARLAEPIEEKAAGWGWGVEALEVMSDEVRLFLWTTCDALAPPVAHQLKGFSSRVPRSEFQRLRSRLPRLSPRSQLGASVGRMSEATMLRYLDEQITQPEKGWL